jgi:predicted Zn-dependent protease
MIRIIVVLLLLAVFLLSNHLPEIGRWLGRRARKGGEWEAALGKAMAFQVEATLKVAEDKRVSRVAARVVAQSGAGDVRTKVIEKDAFNAFALPGGYVYVFRGLVDRMSSDDELAAVIGHEVAHVAAGHARQQLLRSQAMRLIAIPLMTLPGWPGMVARILLNVGGPIAMLKYSRENEHEADRLSVRYLRGAGYDPWGAVKMLEKVSEAETAQPGALVEWLSSHPGTKERIAVVMEEITDVRN